MDWDLAIERNREALRRIVAALFAMAGLADDEVAAMLPRHLRRAMLLVLRPAESAVRRLIVIAAREIVLQPRRQASGRDVGRPVFAPRTVSVSLGLAGIAAPLADGSRAEPASGTEPPVPAFRLLDPLKRFDFQRRRGAGAQPRIRSLSDCPVPVHLRRPEPPLKAQPSADDLVAAAHLCRRMIALRRALDDLPGQAMRLARWRAGRFSGPRRAGRLSPMRPGWPPGRRKRHIHEVDAILGECHALAFRAAERADTS